MRANNRTEYQQVELPCPKCRRRRITFVYRDIYTKGTVYCASCRSEYRFDRHEAYHLKNAIHRLDQARELFARTAQTVLAGADVVIKQ